jgi:uncharacterized protein YdiU (UPF0061 family)
MMDSVRLAASEKTPEWRLENSYARLPSVLFAPAAPVRAREPRIAIANQQLAEDLGLDLSALTPEAAGALFTGQVLPGGSQPIAQAYAGHQFGGFTMLGDGRAILLGERRAREDRLVDIQLKGAGQTRFSRGGDGRAALGPMLREYIVSEAMFSLGIPTTRSLAVATTGEVVYRATPLRGAILTRVAASHIRVGTFQYLAARRDEPNLCLLADYTIERHYPELRGAPQRYFDFIRAVADRQAALIARWQLIGFIHGVMNTDNMAISGETIDYGPCAFMNAYNPQTVFSSIDRAGRYAYGNQPAIAQWNLARFAEALLPLLDPDPARAVSIASEAVAEFPILFDRYWLTGMRNKLGLELEETADRELVAALLKWMHSSAADFTNTFRDLSSACQPTHGSYESPEFCEWYRNWQHRLNRESRPRVEAFAAMRKANPSVIPRNHFVEEALLAAENNDDVSSVKKLLSALASPYEDTSGSLEYRLPSPDDCNYRTFCGT